MAMQRVAPKEFDRMTGTRFLYDVMRAYSSYHAADGDGSRTHAFLSYVRRN